MKQTIKKQKYNVTGMHCSSCEILIEKMISALPGVESVEASLAKGEVFIRYEQEKPLIDRLNRMFIKENYHFSEETEILCNKNTVLNREKKSFWSILGTAILIIIGFIVLNKTGLINLVNINSNSSLPMFLVFGFLAGISTCAALIGGIVLSMSNQWLNIYSPDAPLFKKLQPHLLFNTGRIISYTLFGALLGIIGNKLQFSPIFNAILILVISLVMIITALQMLGFSAFKRLQIKMPKLFTRYISDETNFQGRFLPILLGAATLFLPCGFTITAQGLALLSGNPITGATIMLLFVLGTTPTLFLIGLSSIKFSQKPDLAYQFSRIAAILILFFALYNINNQFNVLGFPSINDLSYKNNKSTESQNDGLPPLKNGKQLIKMSASSSGYNPNYFKVKVGIPVRWEITDQGTSGCTNAIIAKDLFPGQIDLNTGKISVKEFTPQNTGRFKFNCWMGMISGIIEVVDDKESVNSLSSISTTDANLTTSPKTNGCSCCNRSIQ